MNTKLCAQELGTSDIFTKDVVFLVRYFCNDHTFPLCVLDDDFNLNGIQMILIKRSFLGLAIVSSFAKTFGLSKLTECRHINMISFLKLIF